jgi:hypothetical protein
MPFRCYNAKQWLLEKADRPTKTKMDQFRYLETKLQAFECGESGKNENSDSVTHKTHSSVTLNAFSMLKCNTIIVERKLTDQPRQKQINSAK